MPIKVSSHMKKSNFFTCSYPLLLCFVVRVQMNAEETQMKAVCMQENCSVCHNLLIISFLVNFAAGWQQPSTFLILAEKAAACRESQKGGAHLAPKYFCILKLLIQKKGAQKNEHLYESRSFGRCMLTKYHNHARSSCPSKFTPNSDHSVIKKQEI